MVPNEDVQPLRTSYEGELVAIARVGEEQLGERLTGPEHQVVGLDPLDRPDQVEVVVTEDAVTLAEQPDELRRDLIAQRLLAGRHRIGTGRGR